MESFLISADGTIVCDEYSTPVRYSRVMLVHTARICWCCLISYFISELRRDGLWAYPQLSSYSWWGCECNMYRGWQNYTFNFLGEVDVCKLYYWPATVFSRSSQRGTSFDLSLGSFDTVDLHLWDAQSRWRYFLESFHNSNVHANCLDWALQLMYVCNHLLIVISSSGMVASLV
jgi:hypothetical protein